MDDSKSYSIHTSKQSQVDRDSTATTKLKNNLKSTAYRMDLVKKRNGVSFICDTRSNDLLSTRDTFKCMEGPLIWIAASTSHDRDYALIQKHIRHKVKGIVVYGGRGTDMQRKLGHFLDAFSSADNLKEAVVRAFAMAVEGDTILYSPSCVSQDGYDNFADRGAAYEEIIDELPAK